MKKRNILILALIACMPSHVIAKTCAFCTPEVILAQTVYEGQYLRILLDYAPHTYGHLLIVPKRHAQKFDELTFDEANELLPCIKKSVAVFRKLVGTDEYMVLEKNGHNGWQNVPHVHFHVVPVTKEHYNSEEYSSAILKLFTRQKPLEKKELKETVHTFKEAFQAE